MRAREGLSIAERAQAFHTLLEPWLGEPGLTMACGRWGEGAISELMLDGQARLLPARYDGPFAGVRELRLADAPHHLHLDLGRVERIAFTVAPSVCLGFKPSFEVRLLTRTQPQEWLVSLMLADPYRGDQIDEPAVTRFLALANAQVQAHPELTELTIDPRVPATAAGRTLMAWLGPLSGQRDTPAPPPAAAPAVEPCADEPPCVPLLREALALADASLVIFRERTLVEFKTEHLDGVHRFEEDGHVSWQIGAFAHHHCHLALDAVTQVRFEAEPSPCQGGGLNYTVWFLTAGPVGNPFRRDGYFSITLNRPYLGRRPGAAPRLEVVQPVLELYRRYRHHPFVSADARFLHVLAEGPPARPQLLKEQHP